MLRYLAFTFETTKIMLLALASLFCFAGLQGQVFTIRQFGEADGLPSLDVYEVSQDSRGYIWACTESGVLRFDGYQFNFIPIGKRFQHSDVFGTHEDQEGRIWFRTISGEICYLKDEQIFNSDNDALCRKLTFKAPILEIIENGGRLYFLSALDGFKELDGDEVTSYTTEALVSGTAVEDGVALIGYSGSMKMDRNGNFQVIDSTWRSGSYSKASFLDGRLYISNGAYIEQFSEDLSCSDLIFFPKGQEAEVINFNSYNDSLSLVSTRNGVFMLNSRQMTLERIAMEGSAISSCFKDRDGGFWYSTLGEGLFFDPNTAIHPRRLFPDQITDRVFCLYRDYKGRIWAGGTENSVAVLDGDKIETYQFILPNDDRMDRVTKIGAGPGEEIYILGKRFFTRIGRTPKPEVSVVAGNDFLLTGNGYMWVAGTHTAKINELGDRMNFVPRAKNTLMVRSTGLGMMGDTILMATNQGLLVCPNGDTANYFLPELKGMPIAEIQLPYILSDAGGLYKFSEGKAKPIPVTRSPNARFYCLLQHKGFFFFGTNQGLFRLQDDALAYESSLGRVRIYDILGKDDTLILGSDKGLISFPIPKQEVNPTVPLLYIDSIKVNGVHMRPEDLGHLSYTQNTLQISYTGILYSKRPSYRFRINNEPWYPIKNRELNLKLTPGDYQVSIQAENGTQSRSREVQLAVSISRPLWMEGWVQGLGILLLLGGVTLGVRNYFKKIQKDHEQQRQLDQANLRFSESKNRVLELEQKALRLQMNPHFLFNSINSIKGLYATGKIREAITYIHHFSSFLRVVVDHETPLISIRKEVEFLENYLSLEEMKFPNLEYEIEIGEGVDQDRMHIPFMLVQPYVENAILHGIGPKKAMGLISIHFQLADPHHLLVVVEDNGKGLTGKKVTPNKNSMGMRVTAERLALFNAPEKPNILIADREDGEGVRVSFQTRFVYE